MRLCGLRKDDNDEERLKLERGRWEAEAAVLGLEAIRKKLRLEKEALELKRESWSREGSRLDMEEVQLRLQADKDVTRNAFLGRIFIETLRKDVGDPAVDSLLGRMFKDESPGHVGQEKEAEDEGDETKGTSNCLKKKRREGPNETK